MKFLVDMGLARSTAVYLRDSGYDVVHLRDRGLQRMDDGRIVELALAEGRVVLTHDLDFSRIVAVSRVRAPSVVTFRLDDMQPRQVNHYLAQVLARFSDQLEKGALVSVNERGIRVRLLPIGGSGHAPEGVGRLA